MSLQLKMAACLVLLLCSCRGEARVRLNAIRTVILREGHALPVNRSTWEPGLDLTVSAVLSLQRRSRCVEVRSGDLGSLCRSTSA